LACLLVRINSTVSVGTAGRKGKRFQAVFVCVHAAFRSFKGFSAANFIKRINK